ncbi:putative MFS family arabinose efflux permease [Sinobacterium caligoides]|uniref:Putative MFS family arabinose efflux permease n=1 Tax=Sinobacterium caligoides TaxID=933926 RepID=A0A3N2DJG5_9GAMM|nr:MFS transporter [Sinobacterium caligoides]ROR99943.1 putative MFS family arabinose efflux permease [Sinobacterium caligoides]
MHNNITADASPSFIPTTKADGEIARVILSFLATAGLFYVNIMPALINGLIEGLHFSNKEAGMVGSANVYGAALGAFTAVFIIKHIAWRKTAVFLLLSLIVIDLLSSQLSSANLLIIIRFIHGFFGGLLVGIGFSIISRTTNTERTFGYLLTVQFGLGGLGIMYLPGLVPEYGTSILFYTLIAFSAVTLMMLPFLSRYEVEKKTSVDEPNKPLNVKGLLLVLLATFLFQAANMGIYAYIIGMGKQFGLEMDFITNTLGVAAWIAIAGSVLVIFISTKFGRIIPISIGVILTAVGCAILHYSDIKSVYWISNVAVGITWAFVISYLLGMCADFDSSGQTAALGGFASKMGLASGPLAAAFLITGDSYTVMINISVIAVLGCLVVVIPPALYLDRKA